MNSAGSYRVHHYSIHTERSYVDWTVKFIHFHQMHSREDLFPAEPKVEAFLTHLAIDKNVEPSTYNQAMNALIFLYTQVLNRTMYRSTWQPSNEPTPAPLQRRGIYKKGSEENRCFFSKTGARSFSFFSTLS